MSKAATSRATVTIDGHWVRTADGWEKTGQWTLGPQHAPTLHPLVVASLEGMFSLLSLIAFCPTGQAEVTAGTGNTWGSFRRVVRSQLLATASGH